MPKAWPPFTPDDGITTNTIREQRVVENKVLQAFQAHGYPHEDGDRTVLFREKHVAFLMKAIDGLSQGYESLDASKPWLCYWVLHALDLLQAFPINHHARITQYLARCQDPKGGFCGGPGQLPHLAPTYAAVNALVICGGEGESAYDVIDREKLYTFLMRMKSKDGGFTMHEDGEVDVRGTYCALSVARMLNLLTPELTAGAAEYVARCQTYEGGIGGYPGNEGHGGYTFCGLAAMVIMNKLHLLNVPLMLSWVTERQMELEGGFQGRTNKLVDSCYSFWQGALFPLIQGYLRLHDGQMRSSADGGDGDDGLANLLEFIDSTQPANGGEWLFDESALQRYVLLACQELDGGFKDKPGKGRDYYHTCYALSGLAVTQHNDSTQDTERDRHPLPLRTTHPVHNIRAERVAKVIAHFKQFAPS